MRGSGRPRPPGSRLPFRLRAAITSDTIGDIMSTTEKRLVQMRANPKGNWQIADLEVVATALGMKVRKSVGSHVVFSHSTIPARVTVPARRPIKPIYIRQFVTLVDEIQGFQ